MKSKLSGQSNYTEAIIRETGRSLRNAGCCASAVMYMVCHRCMEANRSSFGDGEMFRGRL